MPDRAHTSVGELESRIRSDGWHPECLSDEALLQLLPPFESLQLDPRDRAGLKVEFALHRYMVRYLRGRLGKATGEVQRHLMLLAGHLVLTTDPYIRAPSLGAFVSWFHWWSREVHQRAEERLDLLMYGGKAIHQLTARDAQDCEPAVTFAEMAVLGELLPGDGSLALSRMRTGHAMHVAGVKDPRRLTKHAREEAETAVPDDDLSVASYQRFLSDERRGGPSLLRITDEGVVPDALQVKSRQDKFGCRPVPEPEGRVAVESVAEPVDGSAEAAAELHTQVQEIRAVLVRIRDAEYPGSSRHIVAESLLAQEYLSVSELARKHGRAFEGLRRAYNEIAEEISRIV